MSLVCSRKMSQARLRSNVLIVAAQRSSVTVRSSRVLRDGVCARLEHQPQRLCMAASTMPLASSFE